jgi:hypothetical protein
MTVDLTGRGEDKAILLSKLLSISHFTEEYNRPFAVGLRRFFPLYLPSGFTRLQRPFLSIYHIESCCTNFEKGGKKTSGPVKLISMRR